MKLSLLKLKQYFYNFSISGAPREKLVMGMPIYGRGFQLNDTADNGLYCPAKDGKKKLLDKLLDRVLDKILYKRTTYAIFGAKLMNNPFSMPLSLELRLKTNT
jgi:GH18 family chitinase